jgi:drug/metabolite transporter (DMT)-like permease
MDRRKLFGCLCALGCEVLFGISYLFTKHITSDVTVLELLSWRFFSGTVIFSLLVLLRIFPVHINKEKIKAFFPFVLFSPLIYFYCEGMGIKATTASESGAFLACIPVAALVASSLVLKKKPFKVQVIGVLITIAGVLVCVWTKGLEASFSPYGYFMLTLTVVGCGLYSAYSEKAACLTAVEKTYGMVIAGFVVFSLCAIGEGLSRGTLSRLFVLPFVNSGFLAAVIFLAAGCSVLGFILYNAAIGSIGANRTNTFVGISTIVSIVAGVLVLHENFTAMQTAGTVLILSGVYLANTK